MARRWSERSQRTEASRRYVCAKKRRETETLGLYQTRKCSKKKKGGTGNVVRRSDGCNSIIISECASASTPLTIICESIANRFSIWKYLSNVYNVYISIDISHEISDRLPTMNWNINDLTNEWRKGTYPWNDGDDGGRLTRLFFLFFFFFFFCFVYFIYAMLEARFIGFKNWWYGGNNTDRLRKQNFGQLTRHYSRTLFIHRNFMTV